MILAHAIRLDPTAAQVAALACACGVHRFTYNWALGEWKRRLDAGGKPDAMTLKRDFNAIKGAQFPWIYESPRDANSGAFADLSRAFRNFFAGRARFPVFKKKGRHDSFYLSNDRFSLNGKVARLPVIGRVRMREALRFAGKVLGGRVFRRAGHWFLSVQVEGDFARPVEHRPDSAVGIDLGIKTALVLSTGEKIASPKPLAKALKKLRREQRRLSRKTRGSQNRAKARLRVARVHERVANIRNDWMQKVTTAIAKNHGVAVIEDLNVKGMGKLRSLARALSDAAFGSIRGMLDYKQAIYGHKIVVADRWFASSKRCSGCGAVKPELPLSERTYCCDGCGLVLDRDVNAARNLKEYPGLPGNETPAESGTTPCKRRPRSRKQESAGAHLCALAG